VVAGALALVAIARWGWALLQHAPVLFGEGAVAHAAMLARDRLEYGPYPADAIFVAANYTPLFFHLAAIGDPFVTGRIASIVSTLFVAAAIAYRARRAGVLAAGGLAAAWLAAAPVAVWGPAMKPDLVALALTVAAVLAIDSRRPALAGALLALAIWAKPTEAFPAIALFAYLLLTQRRGVAPFVLSAVVATIVAAVATHLPDGAMLEHVWRWNQLAWHPDQAVLLGIVGLLVAGVPIVALAVLRPRDAIGAYAVGALVVVALGGREGATINYLLDLLAATWLAIAAALPRIATSRVFPIAVVAQTIVAVVLLDPTGILPGRAINTGAWESPERAAVVRSLGGALLVEDSGLLVANGRTPAVDDLFLWSRLQDERGDTRLLDAVRGGTFDAVVSETDLAQLEAAPLWERQRWHPALVEAVLSRYRLTDRVVGLYVYERSRD